MSGIGEARIFDFHGLWVRVENAFPMARAWLDRLCDSFPTGQTARPFAAVGTIKTFDPSEVLRNVTPSAALVGLTADLAQIFACDERFWLVDDRWGICQINLLKHQWRSWVLPAPSADPIRCAEGAMLWPMAQLLKARGLEFIPATSIQKDGWGALILCPWALDSEIERLETLGYQVIGRHWSAVQTTTSRPRLLAVPVLRGDAPLQDFDRPVDCSAVMIVEPGRRAVTRGRALACSEASTLLHRAWPIAELPPNRRRQSSAAMLLARQSRCMSVQLSKREADFVQFVESARSKTVGARKVVVAVNPAIRRSSHAIKSFRPVTFP